MPNFELWHSCRKWATWQQNNLLLMSCHFSNFAARAGNHPTQNKNGTCLFHTQFAWTLGGTSEACTTHRKLSLQTYAPLMSGILSLLVKLGGWWYTYYENVGAQSRKTIKYTN
jgi:hypothetical protein